MHSLHTVLRRLKEALRGDSFWRDTRGMTLVEIAIVLAILGILGGLSLPLLTKQVEHKRALRTKENQERVIYSLAIFVLQQGRLPCPANTIKEGVAPARCDHASQAVGLVPYESLGLSKAEANDGQNKTLSYMVDPVLTRTAQLRGDFSYCEAVGDFLRLFNHNQSISLNNARDPVAVVVLEQRALESLKQSGRLIIGDQHVRLIVNGGTLSTTDAIMLPLWVTRHHLVGWYGKFPCPPSALSLEH